jgi:uncharacterized protein (TIGR03086 family)
VDLETYEKGMDAADRVIRDITPDQYGAPTPCDEWDVRELVNHLVFGNWMFARAASGERVRVDDDDLPDMVGDDPATAFRDSADAAVAAWRSPGAIEQVCHLPFADLPGSAAMRIHFKDVVVHTWDLARATGQDDELDPELASAALEISRTVVNDEMRELGAFGPAVDVDDEAPVHHQLVGFLGRTP